MGSVSQKSKQSLGSPINTVELERVKISFSKYAVPKTKIVKQEPQQQTTPKDTEQTDLASICPQPPLLIQQDN